MKQNNAAQCGNTVILENEKRRRIYAESTIEFPASSDMEKEFWIAHEQTP
jgi:hypothetical protein